MRIDVNTSFLTPADKWAIAHDYGKETVYQLCFDRFFTEEEKEQNLLSANTLSKEEWEKQCDEIDARIGAANIRAIEALRVAGLRIGQYDPKYPTLDCDFWFWGSQGSRSYCTLSFKGNNEALIKAIDILSAIEGDHNRVIVQMQCEYDADKVFDKAFNYICYLPPDKWVKWRGLEGSLHIAYSTGDKLNGGQFYFKKKRARKYVYYLSAKDIFNDFIAQGA